MRYHGARLERTRERLSRLEREMSIRGEADAAATGTPPGHAVMDRTAGLAGASTGERAAYRDYLLARVSAHENAIAKLTERLSGDAPATIDWPEVARILGELPEGASAASARRIANTVEVRVKRLRKRLQIALWGKGA